MPKFEAILSFIVEDAEDTSAALDRVEKALDAEGSATHYDSEVLPIGD